ncbi:MAG: type II secretion system minor pseudopilin GspK [Candidatus Binatus sp.]
MVTHRRKSERGVALLAVLLGVALMTLIVVDFAMTSGLGFVSAANQANELRAGFLARSGVNIGLALLAADARSDAQSKVPIDTLSDVWAVPFPPMALEGGNVSLSIVDEARKLPINAMIQNGGPNQAAILKIERLFTILDVNPDLVQGIIQWITPGGANAPGGGIGDYYMGLKPPYQPRYGPMPTLGDLQMVQGFNEAIFNRVSPFLTVMPEPAVNANTASPQVLAALEPELTEDQKLVQEIIEARTIRPFSQPTDLMNLPDLSAVAQLLSKDVVMRSQFFTINGMGTYAGARKIITATFHREASGIGTLAAWHED